MNPTISQSNVLPMYPGYAIGSIIKKEDLKLPLLKKQSLLLENELNNLVVEKLNMRTSQEFQGNSSKERQSKLNDICARIIKVSESYQETNKQIIQLYNQRSEPFLSSREMLPVDHRVSKIRIEDPSFGSEKMDFLIFKQMDKNIQQRVDKFILNLFSEGESFNYLSSSKVESMVSDIEEMLKAESQVCLIGSFITLPRARTLDPLVIRSDARISDDLQKNAEQYYVLTEAILGGVFLGFGTYVSGSAKKEGQSEIEMTKSVSMSRISFISQGAIPRLGDDGENVNLWQAYTHWKEILNKDPLSGYPIGFKFRELQDVFRENEII